MMTKSPVTSLFYILLTSVCCLSMGFHFVVEGGCSTFHHATNKTGSHSMQLQEEDNFSEGQSPRLPQPAKINNISILSISIPFCCNLSPLMPPPKPPIDEISALISSD